MPKIKLLVTCCSSLFRIGLVKVLSKEKDFNLTHETCEEDIILGAWKANPDILLLCCNFILEKGYNLILIMFQGFERSFASVKNKKLGGEIMKDFYL